MLAPAANDVVAFTASDSAAPTATPATARPTPTRRIRVGAAVPPASGGLGSGGIVGIVVGGLLVIAAAAWIAWRRRTNG
jgi:hypothetical protein